MRRTVTRLLLVLAIASPLVAQSTARQDGAPREAASGPTTRYSRLYVFGDSGAFDDVMDRSAAHGIVNTTAARARAAR